MAIAHKLKEQGGVSEERLVEATLKDWSLYNWQKGGGPDAPIFVMPFSGGDRLFFQPHKMLKNGNWKGKKSIQTSIDKADFRLFKQVDEVPPKVAAKF